MKKTNTKEILTVSKSEAINDTKLVDSIRDYELFGLPCFYNPNSFRQVVTKTVSLNKLVFTGEEGYDNLIMNDDFTFYYIKIPVTDKFGRRYDLPQIGFFNQNSSTDGISIVPIFTIEEFGMFPWIVNFKLSFKRNGNVYQYMKFRLEYTVDTSGNATLQDVKYEGVDQAETVDVLDESSLYIPRIIMTWNYKILDDREYIMI